MYACQMIKYALFASVHFSKGSMGDLTPHSDTLVMLGFARVLGMV